MGTAPPVAPQKSSASVIVHEGLEVGQGSVERVLFNMVCKIRLGQGSARPEEVNIEWSTLMFSQEPLKGSNVFQFAQFAQFEAITVENLRCQRWSHLTTC